MKHVKLFEAWNKDYLIIENMKDHITKEELYTLSSKNGKINLNLSRKEISIIYDMME